MSRTGTLLAIALTTALGAGAQAEVKAKEAAAKVKIVELPESAVQHVSLTPDELNWGPAPAILPAGAKLAVLEGDPAQPGPFTIRLAFPAGYRVAPHWHPGLEHVTVISGTVNIAMGDKFDLAAEGRMPAGSYALMAPMQVHFAWATTDAVVQIHGDGPWALIYADPKDDPSRQLRR